MLRTLLLTSTIGVLAPVALCATADAQAKLPDLSGTYRCEPYPASCNNSGATFTVTQSGAKVDIKNDKGAVGQGSLTSPMTVSVGAPWNTIGVISPDGRTIEWSAGTRWRKQ
jgi:hypothetical protein